MLRGAGTLLAGMIFGVGLAVSEMINPAKVLAFLDIAGRWDPSLAFVMAGALAVTAIGFRAVLKRPAPWFDQWFEVPSRGEIDGRLIAGATVFGVGWGLVGFCPGPAIASLAYGYKESLVFVASMLAGMALYNGSSRRTKPVSWLSKQT